MNKPFLQEFAELLAQKHPAGLKEVAVIVPGKRSIVFLKSYLAKTYQKTIYLPKFYTIEDFAAEITGLEMADSVDLLFDFYQCYLKVETEQPESFEEFNKWALTLLKDFNDIDNSLIDTKDFFRYIFEYFSLQQWNPNPTELSDFQKKYLHFWKSVGTYYQAFQEVLKDEVYAYHGYILKKLAHAFTFTSEATQKKLDAFEIIYFAGFNALTAAEESVIASLMNKKKALCVFDVDPFYFDKEEHEAGAFIRHFLDKRVFKENSILINQKSGYSEPKNIKIIGANNLVEQAKYASTLVNDPFYQENTCVVLGDENLLIPLLNSLPEHLPKFNITLGYPMKNTAYSNLFSKLFDLYRFYSLDKKFYYKTLIEVLELNLIYLNKDDRKKVQAFMRMINNQNYIKISLKTVLDLNIAHFNYLFYPALINPKESIATLVRFCDYLFELREQENQAIDLEQEYLFQFKKIFLQLELYANKYEFANDWLVLKMVFDQIAKNKSIPFIGEPLGGLQIMGMLETRLLDFKNIILLSANEGILPKEKFENSFIPFEIKKNFKLTTYQEKDSIFSYHFYRLLQRAENIHLFYNTSQKDEFSKAEPSRYILQIEYELPRYNPSLKIDHIKLSTSSLKSDKKEVVIEKDALIQQRIQAFFERGVSASAINVYNNCPLDFYFKYIVRVLEDKVVEEEMEDNTLGNIFHQVLEVLFAPCVGRVLVVQDIDEMLKKVEEKVHLAFLKLYQDEDIKNGKNVILFELVTDIIKKFLHQQKRDLQALKPAEFIQIEGLEKQYNYELPINQQVIRLVGNIDRIEKTDQHIRIIDYKTGKYEDYATKLKSMDDLISKKNGSKTWQLLFYAYLYFKNHPQSPSVQSGIWYLKKLSLGFDSLAIEGSSDISVDVMQQFEQILQAVLANIANPALPFQHNPDSKYCMYC